MEICQEWSFSCIVCLVLIHKKKENATTECLILIKKNSIKRGPIPNLCFDSDLKSMMAATGA
jgi:hypothetical protein